MTKTIFAFFLIAVLLAGTIAPASFAQAPGLDKIRVVAHDGIELDKAKANGCKVVREAGSLNGVICNPKVAESLGLKKDIQLFAVDVNANSQIGADLVQATNNGEGTTIAILDTGYNRYHPDLVSSYKGGYNFVNNNDNPLDDHGHGSHVAGIITSDGINSNSKGVAPAADVYSYKVLDQNGSGSFTDTLAAFQLIVWGPDGQPNPNNIDVISLSLGSSKPDVWKTSCDTVWPEMTAIIQDAKSNGIAVVIAAGNDGRAGVSFPGCISDSITVSAVDNKDKVARFSGVGTAVDIAAPGVSIYSTLLGDSYGTKSGTSMATPMITGTIALMKSANNGLSVNDIESALFDTATDLGNSGKDTKSGHGRVNADLAVAYSPGPVNNPPTVTILNPSSVDPPFTSGSLITFDATASDVEDDDTSLTATISWESNIDGSIDTGGLVSKVLSDGVHTITAEVKDSGQKTNSDSITITVGEITLPQSTSVDLPIVYSLTGGKNSDRHLLVTIHVIDNLRQNVAGADVSITMDRDTPPPFTYGGNGLTDGNGNITFQLSNAKSGCYTTVVAVDSVPAWDGVLPQDGSDPDNPGFCKP